MASAATNTMLQGMLKHATYKFRGFAVPLSRAGMLSSPYPFLNPGIAKLPTPRFPNPICSTLQVLVPFRQRMSTYHAEP